jgi:GDP-mannose 6-dehydrogenase
LGYVGCVSAACLAKDGHTVVGVDIDARKVGSVGNGETPFHEPGLEEILRAATAEGRLRATTNELEAIEATDVAMVCVGTPSERTGETRLDALRGAMASIGAAVRLRESGFVVVLRSTVMPSVVEGELIPLLERAAGRKLGDRLGFCYNPEFLREGTAIRDFYEAPMVVIGHRDDRTAEIVAELYSQVAAPVVYTDIATACLVKYACNAFHALKVSFANEIGQLSEALDASGRRVMEIVCMDTKLNISPMYMKPGFAFGGSCLPKDLRAIGAESRRRGIPTPLLQSIVPSNEAHLRQCVDTVLETGETSIGLFGLTFKEGTDDLRESPAVALAEALLGKGKQLAIYEPIVSQETIHGTNLAFVEKTIPHVWKLMTSDISDLLKKRVVVLLKRPDAREREALAALSAEQTCIDFSGTLVKDELRAETAIFGLPRAQACVA